MKLRTVVLAAVVELHKEGEVTFTICFEPEDHPRDVLEESLKSIIPKLLGEVPDRKKSN